MNREAWTNGETDNGNRSGSYGPETQIIGNWVLPAAVSLRPIKTTPAAQTETNTVITLPGQRDPAHDRLAPELEAAV